MLNHYDIIVIGTGSMGSAACYAAAKRGLRVLGIDQYNPPHSSGSHSGQSRIIRQAYFEHADYVPLLRDAYELWNDLEKESGKKLFHKSGLLYLGKATQQLINGVLNSSRKHQVPIEELDDQAIKERFPAFDNCDTLKAVFEPNAGHLYADECIQTIIESAKKHGAEFIADRKVIRWELRNEFVKVNLRDQSFTADKIIVTAGAYVRDLIPRFRRNLKVTRQSLHWLLPKDEHLFSKDNFSCWNLQFDESHGLYYGFPYLDKSEGRERWGLKIAHHAPHEITFAEADNKRGQVNELDRSNILTFLEKYLPAAAGEFLSSTTCYYTYSPDEDFIIDHLPFTDERVVVATGLSGHGFKFTPAIGELLVELASDGNTSKSVDFLRITRFDEEK